MNRGPLAERVLYPDQNWSVLPSMYERFLALEQLARMPADLPDELGPNKMTFQRASTEKERTSIFNQPDQQATASDVGKVAFPSIAKGTNPPESVMHR